MSLCIVDLPGECDCLLSESTDPNWEDLLDFLNIDLTSNDLNERSSSPESEKNRLRLSDEKELAYRKEESSSPDREAVTPCRNNTIGSPDHTQEETTLNDEEKMKIWLELQQQVKGRNPGNLLYEWTTILAGLQDDQEILASETLWEEYLCYQELPTLIARAVQYESKPEPGKLPLQERMNSLKIGVQLTYDQKGELRDLLLTKDHAFAWTLMELGKTIAGENRISTGNASPIKQRPYRFSPQENEVVRLEIEKMLEAGIIRKSKSPWASPVVVVPKSDGSPRFCIDYRKLNSVTKKDVYPLPRIDEALDTLAGSKYFSALDLKAGYWQIPLSNEDAEKTAFTTKFGLFEFIRMPFGLSGAPAIFQRLMDEVLGELLWKTVIVYLDDIIVFTRDWEEHLRVLSQVIDKLHDAGLRISPTKSDFCFGELLYLGHIVSGDTVKPNPKKVRAIEQVPRPMTVKEVRSFLGLASYYRRFIQGFARIAVPLTQLLKKDTPWQWNESQEEAFVTLKKALTHYPILRAPDFSLPFIIQTDWSKEAIGAILCQRHPEGEAVVAYASRRNSPSEQNYAPVEGECLAARWGIEYFRPYVYGRHFTLQTDQRALTWLMNTSGLHGHLLRWSLRLQHYDFSIEYRAGKKNANVDALSRLPQPDNPEPEEQARGNESEPHF